MASMRHVRFLTDESTPTDAACGMRLKLQDYHSGEQKAPRREFDYELLNVHKFDLAGFYVFPHDGCAPNNSNRIFCEDCHRLRLTGILLPT